MYLESIIPSHSSNFLDPYLLHTHLYCRRGEVTGALLSQALGAWDQHTNDAISDMILKIEKHRNITMQP